MNPRMGSPVAHLTSKTHSSPSNSNGRGRKLAIVLSHPTQYYSPWFRWLQSNTELDLRVYYLWNFGVTAQRDPKFQTVVQWDVDLLSGYQHEFVPNLATDPGTHHFTGLRNPDLIRRLSAWSPDAILLFGYKWHSHLRVIAWGRWRGIPLLFRGDSHFLGRGRPPLGTRLLLRAMYRQFAAVLPVGQANSDYFTTLGVPSSRQFLAPHSVDHRLFDPASAIHRERAIGLREQLGLSASTRVVLFAGKLVPEKQPNALLEAFISVAQPDTALVFVGEGPERDRLKKCARDAPTGVHFLPFANQSEMPARYLMADIFVLPSRGFYETWGLAVNEAMHLGVPALVSDRVGCQRDLVTDGETGWVFCADHQESLRQQLQRALWDVANPARRAQLKSAVQERIAKYTYEQTSTGLLNALREIQPANRSIR